MQNVLLYVCNTLLLYLLLNKNLIQELDISIITILENSIIPERRYNLSSR